MSWKRSGSAFFMTASSGELGTRLHRERAFVVARPEREPPLALGPSAQRERVDVEQRADGLERETPDDRLRVFATKQIEQQGGDQRPMHDQARIALDLGDVAAVVVDAVAVEGEGRITKEQDVVGYDG